MLSFCMHRMLMVLFTNDFVYVDAEGEVTKLSALSPKERRILLREVQEAADKMMDDFRSLRMATQIYLEDSGCSKERLVACICDVRHIKQPSSSSLLNGVECAKTIAGVFITLVKKNLISFLQYNIVKHIINNMCLESEKLMTMMKCYEESFSTYIQRWVCESSIYHEGKFEKFNRTDFDDDVNLVIITDDSWNEYTPFLRIRDLERILQKAFRCSSIFLKLESIEPHCLKLQYSVSLRIVNWVFPLTAEEWNYITRHGIAELECLNYHYSLQKKGIETFTQQ